MKKGRRFGDIVSNIYLILLSIVAVFPLLWLLVSAFKSSSEMLNNPTKIWPIQWTLENFKTVLFTLKFTVNIRNSLIIAGSTTVVAIIISSLAAYGVVRFFPKLGNVMTKILVTTYMFPSIMLVIPYAMVMAKLNLTNTRIGLMLVTFRSAFLTPCGCWSASSRLYPSVLRKQPALMEPTSCRSLSGSCCRWFLPASLPLRSMFLSMHGMNTSTP
mgnify:CR=1 FL=1